MPHLTLTNGRKLFYAEAGTGEPLILVHGSPGEHRMWGKVLEHLTPRFRLLIPDLPGHAASDPMPAGEDISTPATAEALAELIDLAGQPVWMAAHSYGGNLTLHAAVRRPGKVLGLALFEPVFFQALKLAGEQETYESARRFFTLYADRVLAGRTEAVADLIDYWFGAGGFARLPQEVKDFVQAAAPGDTRDITAAFSDPMTKEDLAGLAIPVLIATGAASPPVAPAIAKALGRLLSNVRTSTVGSATHGLLASHPQVVAKLIEMVAKPKAPSP
jgi:pimeloyl-ACP methyl ester carboxylesterase